MEIYDFVLVLVGGGLSLIFSFVPVFKNWFDTKEPAEKQLWMLLFNTVGFGVVVAVACLGLSEQLDFPGVVCNKAGIFEAVLDWVKVIGANYITYGATKKLRKEPLPFS